jgi:hypothetical protein
MLVLSSLRRACVPIAIAVVMPLTAQSQETVLGTWNGRVDKEMQITIRGNRASSNTVAGQQFNGRFRLATDLPRQDGVVRLAVTRGRGEVSVVQQPSSANGYTAVVRLLDRGSGADNYRVTLYWTPTNAGYGRRGGMQGRGNGVGVGRGVYGQNGRSAAVLRWRGDVDADAEIRWRPGSVTQRNLDGNVLRAVRSSLGGSPVAQAGEVTVTSRQGRGNVTVVQQPAANNRWTAVIRISDPQAGYGHYDIDASWQ